MLLDPVQSRVAFEHALASRYALLAINADSHAALSDALEAARECQAPIMIETSLWQLTGHSFGNGDALLGLARYAADLAVLAASERYRDVPVILHADHIKGPDALKILKAGIEGVQATFGDATARLAFSTLSLDSSELDEAENIATVKALCQHAQALDRPLTMEVEAGLDKGVTEIDTARRILRPLEDAYPGAVALWAPGVGTSHGLGAADGFSAEAVAEHQRVASELAGRPIGIALHGSSGLPAEQLQAAVQAGAVKVNWSSESLLIRSSAARDYYAENGEQLEKGHPDWKNTAMDNGVQRYVSKRYAPIVAQRIRLLGGHGQARALMQVLNEEQDSRKSDV